MGYMSDVGLAVTNKLRKKLMADAESKELLGEADEVSHSEGSLFIWEYIKWNDGYSDVQSVEKIIATIEKDYFFIRTGELDGDVEMYGEWSDNPFCLGYTTKIWHNGCNVENKTSLSDADLKEINSQSSSNYCARCGIKLKVPQPSIKFCPVCEG